MTIGEALRKERENLHYTQTQMIENTSISLSHYSKIENDTQDIKAKDLFQLLTARKIDINEFSKEVMDNMEKSLENLSDELIKAFYRRDIKLAEQIKMSIDKFSNADELQIRSELVVAVLTNTINYTKKKLSNRLTRYFQKNNNWLTDADMLRIVGNSTRIIDFNLLAVLMDKLLEKYKKIETFPLDTQKRIGNIFINYLHVLYDYGAVRTAQKYVIFLEHLPEIPELVFCKLIGYYYDALFSGDDKRLKEISSVLKILTPKILSGLPKK
ncbi:helix-turn-helix domain-containing protein [Lactobacillus intestinalis]|uniref:Transcriptional regulator n=1 Tax=Lactobacillus intestinalis DSM 6629 TaxID=1423761 RepID=A0ABR5PRX7_9LACO|nr:helix-turn-helix transcriptional regulator [Lactobacillus intestinalis]KRM32938.1 transcriptional regulator [Lactobacillus intestinalis DSM 6629]UTW40497.1 helix-turn-helix transcriptional regulator [Lactobacillus intestinalis]